MENKVKKYISVSEIFLGIQGESSFAGSLCIMIRLAGCNLNCKWCDTLYAKDDRNSNSLSIEKVLDYTIKLNMNNLTNKDNNIEGLWEKALNNQIPITNKFVVEVTGGEPLQQAGTIDLLKSLSSFYDNVLLETNGSISVKKVPKKVKIIMDIKTPSSSMEKNNNWNNLNILTPKDEIKFVITNRNDYEWTKKVIEQYDLFSKKITILFSPTPINLLKELSLWILNDKLPVRIQPQLHKLIWKDELETRYKIL